MNDSVSKRLYQIAKKTQWINIYTQRENGYSGSVMARKWLLVHFFSFTQNQLGMVLGVNNFSVY